MSLRMPRWAVGTSMVNGICSPCLRKLSRLAVQAQRRHATTAPTLAALSNSAAHPVLRQRYFLSNTLWNEKSQVGSDDSRNVRDAVRGLSGFAQSKQPASTAAPITEDTVLPHRRRKRTSNEDDPSLHSIPLDASTQLSNLSSQLPQNSLKQRFFTYLSLSKPRLTFLIVLTTTSAYTLFPVAVSPMSSSLALSPLTLLNLTTGTALSCASANALNMLFEPEHDAKMTRTRARPIVRGLISPRGALGFAVITGTAGLALLNFGVDPTVAFLSALNIFVYAGLYTPLKRISVVNTWVGAVVGGIPPMMGWTAAAAQSNLVQNGGWRELLFDPTVSAGGWCLAALLFAWQFPHFNALSYTIRHEYANAGYKMLASINPAKNALIALRYSLLMFPICAGLCWFDVTSWPFLPVATAVNAWMTREAWRFYKYEGGKGSARGLFWASVWHLPLVLVLAMAMKKGLWDRVFFGGLDEEEWEEYTSPPAKIKEEDVPVRDSAVRPTLAS